MKITISQEGCNPIIIKSTESNTTNVVPFENIFDFFKSKNIKYKTQNVSLKEIKSVDENTIGVSFNILSKKNNYKQIAVDIVNLANAFINDLQLKFKIKFQKYDDDDVFAIYDHLAEHEYAYGETYDSNIILINARIELKKENIDFENLEKAIKLGLKKCGLELKSDIKWINKTDSSYINIYGNFLLSGLKKLKPYIFTEEYEKYTRDNNNKKYIIETLFNYEKCTGIGTSMQHDKINESIKANIENSKLKAYINIPLEYLILKKYKPLFLKHNVKPPYSFSYSDDLDTEMANIWVVNY